MGRLFKTAALAGAAYALWTWLKGQLEESETGDAPPPRAMPARPPVQKATPKAKAEAKAEAAPVPEEDEEKRREPAAEEPKQAPASSSNGSPTKAELYERATELDISGRSKMSKAELERAIRDAG